MARTALVPVPVDAALTYDGRSWRIIAGPPAWWLELTDPDNDPVPFTVMEGATV